MFITSAPTFNDGRIPFHEELRIKLYHF